MQCFDCNHINEKNSKFCSNCGKKFNKRKGNTSNNTANKNDMNFQDSHNHKSVYPNKQAVTLHEAKQQEKAYNSVAVIVIFSIILVLVILMTQNLLGSCIGAFFVAIFFFTLLFAKKSVTEQYYYTLPGSRDSEKNHKCIFCGNKGIYKSTIYQTNTVVNSCSKCQKPLFRN